MQYLILAALAWLVWSKIAEAKPAPTPNGGTPDRLPPGPEGREPRPDLVVELDGNEWTELLNVMANCQMQSPGMTPEELALCGLQIQESGFPWPPVDGDHPSVIDIWTQTVALVSTGGPHPPGAHGLHGEAAG